MKKASEPFHTSPSTPQPLLQQISTLFSQGEARQALAIAEQGIARFPDSDALYNLAGVCAVTLGAYERAEHFWRRAITINAGAAQYQFNLARLQASRGLDTEAEQRYRQAIALDDANVDARVNLGVVLARNRRYDEAERCYRQALTLQPDNAMAHANLGVLLAQVGRNDEAEQSYRRAIALDDGDATAHSNLGVLLADRGQDAQAEQCYRRAIELKPENAAAFSNLGLLLTRGERYGEAEQCYRIALALAPDNARTHTNFGLLLEALDRHDEAEHHHRKAVTLAPHTAEILANLGNLLTQRRNEDEAEGCYRRALALEPRSAVIHCNLGVLLNNLGRDVEAEQCFRQAITLDDQYALARLSLAFLLLRQGRFSEGWRLHENRYAPSLPDFDKLAYRPDMPFLQWRGEPLRGKSLLVWPEQGLGDEIQFCRYIPHLKRQGAAHITLVCKPPLKALMATLAGVDTVIGSDALPATLPAHDYWSYPLSFPLRCQTDLTNLPSTLPYLHAAPERVNHWAARLPDDGLRVGLVWKGNRLHHNDSYRSVPDLSMLAPLWSVPDVHFISLQKGQRVEQGRNPPADQPLIHLGDEIQDFADTAAIVAQLDLVICVDTAVAHLAGALGRPCWVMLPAYRTDWRWLKDRQDSPWYPETLRLFRQAADEDWAPVVQDIKQHLLATVTQRQTPT